MRDSQNELNSQFSNTYKKHLHNLIEEGFSDQIAQQLVILAGSGNLQQFREFYNENKPSDDPNH